ncbi:homeobox-leucine zipper protein PROTODERMAL FACTOR 2-like [Durio zibethinus]|uniref:Homeobox-leucine zipper protein PROTODERMAL FACTOR 2-like n=1 Tax=Durio zibethinus TaxID=66656 RepID=A0A6P5WP88_DURZI|nr:homeobox-leucine zipper protein PROTODERMAL FACTOR 2-like [Durio zibethinus]
MENMGENGANGSDDIQEDNYEEQFNNGGFDNIENRVEAMEHSMEPLPAASRDEIEVDDNQLGLNHPPEMNPEEDNDDISQSNEDVGSPSLYNPQSPTNSPGSESSTNVRTDHVQRASDLLMAVSVGAELNKNKIIEQAMEAMEELIQMASKGEPLWQRKGNSTIETLNGLQYLRGFVSFDPTMEEIIRMVEIGEPQCFPSFDFNNEFPQDMQTSSSKLEFEPLHIEASREIGFVNMNPIDIVELLMDSKQWSTIFSNIVSTTTLLGVILDGTDGSYNGMLQVMTAEFHQATPLIPARQSYFARYCRKLNYGTWGVVDVSLENLFPYPQVQFRRRPSGCLIQEMPNGSSKVTWVEHVEVDNRSLHPIFLPIVSSGFAFSAKRWIAMINRHCQWLATSMATSTPTDAGVLIPQSGRESLLKLAERMTRNFFMNISSCTQNIWMQLPKNIGGEDIRFRFGNTLAVPRKPPSSTIIFTTSLRLPIPTKILFDFLRHEHSRNKWDLLSNERFVRELAYVINGENPENRVSVMQVNSSPNKIEILYLQESFTDETGSYVIYAPIDIFAMSMILNGGNPKFAAVLPSGFAILPDKPPGQGEEPVGSILTIAFHTADRSSTEEYIPPATLRTIDAVLTTTAASIKDAIIADWSEMQFVKT